MRYEEMVKAWREMRDIWRKNGDPIRYGELLDRLLLPVLVKRKKNKYLMYDPVDDEIQVLKNRKSLYNLNRDVWIIEEGNKIRKVILTPRVKIPKTED